MKGPVFSADPVSEITDNTLNENYFPVYKEWLEEHGCTCTKVGEKQYQVGFPEGTVEVSRQGQLVGETKIVLPNNGPTLTKVVSVEEGRPQLVSLILPQKAYQKKKH